jgi:hypothetical protein
MYAPDDNTAEETGGRPSRDCAGSTDGGVGVRAGDSDNNGSVANTGCTSGEGCAGDSDGKGSMSGS